MTTQAWHGDWEKRIYERVFQRDFASLTAFADSQPTATLKQLTKEISSERDIAAVQLETLLRDEAQRDGHVHRFARATLVREIYEYFPQGWNRPDQPSPGPSSPEKWYRGRVFAEWSTSIGEEYDAVVEKVFDCLEKTAPVGWLPSGPDDPIIVRAFREGRFPEDSDPGEKDRKTS